MRLFGCSWLWIVLATHCFGQASANIGKCEDFKTAKKVDKCECNGNYIGTYYPCGDFDTEIEDGYYLSSIPEGGVFSGDCVCIGTCASRKFGYTKGKFSKKCGKGYRYVRYQKGSCEGTSVWDQLGDSKVGAQET